MEYFWLNKKNNDKLILIFNGWGMNETPYNTLKCLDYDVLILSDYRNFNLDIEKLIEGYKEKYLICWSMGVYVAGYYDKILNNFKRKIAINGTGLIVDNNFGIPEKIYDVTVKFLSESSLDKFIKNMFKDGTLNPNIKITRNISELKEELIKIKNLKINGKINYDKVIISNMDRIIPSKNQFAYWKDRAEILEIQSTHCPFEKFQTFEEILWS